MCRIIINTGSQGIKGEAFIRTTVFLTGLSFANKNKYCLSEKVSRCTTHLAHQNRLQICTLKNQIELTLLKLVIARPYSI